MSTTDLPVVTSVSGGLGRIVLDRPAAINALSAEMIGLVTDALTRWANDPAVRAVLFEGAGPKGFCAGGDVRAVRSLVLDGTPERADAYFAAEYAMNALIATFPKPLVAVTHGVTMGGGIGIAGHCRFRVTQAGARFAMPESAIGFFADVGVNAILAKAPLERALLFLLSGVTVGTADALELGLADAVIAADHVETFRADLARAAIAAHPEDAIGRLVLAESIEPGEAGFCRLADRLPSGVGANLDAFLAACAADPALADLSAMLATRCPTSLVATHEAQLAARRHMDIHAALDGDLRLAALMVRRADFAEGVRAVLVDKDQSPRWQPERLTESDSAPIMAALRGV